MKNKGKIKWDWPSRKMIEQMAEWDRLHMDPAWRPEQWSSLSPPNYHLVYLTVEEELVAFALYYLPFGVDTAHLLKIVVSPESRNNKFGLWVLEESEIMMKSLGAERIFLEVAVENLPAQRLYNKWGMTVLHRQKNFYGQGRDALTMQKECKKTKTSN